MIDMNLIDAIEPTPAAGAASMAHQPDMRQMLDLITGLMVRGVGISLVGAGLLLTAALTLQLFS